jgi:hypothetical protein
MFGVWWASTLIIEALTTGDPLPPSGVTQAQVHVSKANNDKAIITMK